MLQIGAKPVVTETEKQKEKEQVKSAEPSVHSSSGGGSGARHLSVDELFRSQSELNLGYQSSKQVYYVLNYLFNGVVCIVFKALHKQFLLKQLHYRPYLTKLGKSVDLDKNLYFHFLLKILEVC